MGTNSPVGWRDGSVAEGPLRILQVSTSDIEGGAEKIAWNHFQTYRERGLGSLLAVGRKYSRDPDVLLVPWMSDSNRCSRWTHAWLSIADMVSPSVGRIRGAEKLRHWLRFIGHPQSLLENLRGHEDFYFPGTWQLLDLPRKRPEILHCHNLHGGYFDLRAIHWLSHQIPTILTLHDAWLLSGHCAHSFDCERWKTGCGYCPDLSIYPAIKRDATSYNWQRKRQIITKSRLYVATPSRWLMEKVEQSMLAPAIAEARVIPHGVDLSTFHPADRQTVRTELGIPQHAKVLLFTAYGIRRNIWKDWETMRSVIALIAERLRGQDVLFIALGEDAPAERIGRATIVFVTYQKDPRIVARYYQAADVYVHAARVEVWGLTITEALACGIPVVATAIGGIPEQVEDGKTGFLVAPGDAEAMATAIARVLTNQALRNQLGQNAAQVARERYDLYRQVDDYVEWYQTIVERINSGV